MGGIAKVTNLAERYRCQRCLPLGNRFRSKGLVDTPIRQGGVRQDRSPVEGLCIYHSHLKQTAMAESESKFENSTRGNKVAELKTGCANDFQLILAALEGNKALSEVEEEMQDQNRVV